MNLSHLLSRTGQAVGILIILSLAAGCGRNDAKSYQVPKEQATAAGDAIQMPPGHPDVSSPSSASAAMPQLQWKLPAGWQEGKPSSMRKASFSVQGDNGQSADVAVIPVPHGGNDLELVNMWRSQMQLSPVGASEAEKESAAADIGEAKGKLFEIASEAPVIKGGLRGRILVAVINKDGLDWFFKMSGEESLVAAQKPVFVEFLKSVSFEPAAPAAMVAADPHAHVAGEPHATASSAGPKWTVPVGWQEASPGQFLAAKFIIAGEAGAKADVNVSTSAGDGGGLAANVNRWRGQLGQSPWSAADMEKQIKTVAVTGGDAAVVEMSGTDARAGKAAALVGIIVPHGGQTWFYKLMGDATIVESQKDAFVGFVEGVKY